MRPLRLIAATLLVAASAAMAGCDDDGSGPTETVAPQPAPTATTATAGGAGSVALAPFADGLELPMQVVAAGDELWAVEQGGTVRRVTAGTVEANPILDLTTAVSSGGERGLLSLTTHPDFPRDPRVYVHFSDTGGDTRVQEHRVNGGVIDPEAVRVLLKVDQPYPNHNGGSLAFGADGLLYLGLGDGGSANDPGERAQDLDSQLGKLLRADVDAPDPEWQIAAYGLRNPWRLAFDPATGDAWIGDVGQSAWEEVNIFPRGSGLRNYGWDVFEGRERSSDDDVAELGTRGTLTPPVLQYSHDEGCSITGGVVVRGGAVPALRGRYVYGDYCSGTIWSVPAAGRRTPRREPVVVPNIVSIDADAAGTVYITSQDGTIRTLTAN